MIMIKFLRLDQYLSGGRNYLRCNDAPPDINVSNVRNGSNVSLRPPLLHHPPHTLPTVLFYM